jgi:chromosome segregation ATPase
MGRWLTKLASFKLGPRAVAADRPTEMAIAFSAENLYHELPKNVRKSLGDLPAALRDLEAQARVMRAHMGELDAMIEDAQSGRATTRGDARVKRESLTTDLRAARSAAERRLADLVTALESLRLDLLRLRAGQGTAESITQGLEVARALGEDVDRLIAGAAEVDASLARHDHSSTPV